MRWAQAISPGIILVGAFASCSDGTAPEPNPRVDLEPETHVVVDSTVLYLVSDSTALAAGFLEFRITGTLPLVEVGDVLVGAQKGGFLSRVEAVEEQDSLLLVTTTPAALTEIIESGELQGSATVGPEASGAGVGNLRWGSPELNSISSGVRAVSTGVSVTGLVLYQAENVTVTLTDGFVGFTPDVELFAKFEEWSVTGFRAIASGDLQFYADVEINSRAAWAFSGDTTLASYARPFYAQIGTVPVAGKIVLELVLTWNLDAEFTQSMQAGFEASGPMRFGGRYEAPTGWTKIWEPPATFIGRPFSAAHEGRAGARVSVRPKVSVILYNLLGPTMYADPYGNWVGLVDITRGTWSTEVTAGIDAGVGINIVAPPFGASIAEYTAVFDGPSRVAYADSGTLLLDSIRITPRDPLFLHPGKADSLSVARYWGDQSVSFGVRSTSWSTRDPDVVSVDEHGVITGKTSGSTYVVAAADTYLETERTDSIRVTVRDLVMVIEPDSVGLIRGDSATLQARLLSPDGAEVEGYPITWTSSEPAVATARGNGSEAAITAVSEGTATIQATGGGTEGSTEVTVRTAVVQVEPDTLSLNVDSSAEVRVRIVDSGGDAIPPESIEWGTSDSTILAVVGNDSTATVTGLALGSAWVIAATNAGADSSYVVVGRPELIPLTIGNKWEYINTDAFGSWTSTVEVGPPYPGQPGKSVGVYTESSSTLGSHFWYETDGLHIRGCFDCLYGALVLLYPAEPGQEFQGNYGTVYLGACTFGYEGTVVVKSPEEVTVAAGTFAAIHYQRRVDWDDGYDQCDIWVAPGVGIVKSELRTIVSDQDYDYSWRQELTSYELH